MDILLSFVTAYKSHNGTVISKRRDIAKKYLSRMFWIDLVSVLPLYLINSDGYVVKIFRCLHYKRAINCYSKILIKCSKNGYFLIKSLVFFLVFTFVFGALTSSWAHLGVSNEDGFDATWIQDVDES